MSFDLAADIMKKKITASVIMVLFFGILVTGAYLTRVISPSTDNKEITSLPYYGVGPDFTLPSVNGDNYTFYNDTGKIRILNFMYTKCPGDQGCSLLSQLIFQLYSAVLQAGLIESVRFVSIDFDFINDTMSDLSDYAHSYTQNTTQWNFLLGNQTQTYEVAQAWNFNFTVNPDALSLNHGDEEHPDPYLHPLIVYFIDQANNWRYTEIGTNWDIAKEFNVIQYLYDNPPFGG